MLALPIHRFHQINSVKLVIRVGSIRIKHFEPKLFLVGWFNQLFQPALNFAKMFENSE